MWIGLSLELNDVDLITYCSGVSVALLFFLEPAFSPLWLRDPREFGLEFDLPFVDTLRLQSQPLSARSQGQII